MLLLAIACTVETPVQAGPPAPSPAIGTVVQRQQQPVLVAPPGTASVRPLARGDHAFIADLWIEPGAQVPEHRDATEEYLVFLEGGGTLTMDGVAHTVQPGSVVTMPANARVAYVNGPVRAHVLQVFAGPSPADKYDAWKPR